MLKFEHPNAAIAALADRLSVAGHHRFESSHSAVPGLRDDGVTGNGVTGCALMGRVLATDVIADRDSPAADVSAMDGYAIRLSDLKTNTAIVVSGECAAGAAPPAMPPAAVVRIFTGAVIPSECEAVVKREDTVEFGDTIEFCVSAMNTVAGENIRRAGENAKANDCILAAGSLITSAGTATLVNFGTYCANVFDRVRVSILTTGDEVDRFENESPEVWQLRNSNAAALESLVRSLAFVEFIEHRHCRDDRRSLRDALERALQQSDAVLVTGGVSKGDYDYVPEIIAQAKAEILFHGLPIRPGKPILGAATQDGKLVLGLAGNPVSAVIGCRRFAQPLLAKMSGRTEWQELPPMVLLENAGSKTLPLHSMRLVRMLERGVAEPVRSLGSGDLVSLGQSVGFVEIPPGESGAGPWPFYAWPS